MATENFPYWRWGNGFGNLRKPYSWRNDFPVPTVKFHFENKVVEVGPYANLRRVALLNKIGVYQGAARCLNCRGFGVCGTCVVEVLDGMENLTPRTRIERLQLRKFSPTLRLACQTQIVKGSVTLITNPKI